MATFELENNKLKVTDGNAIYYYDKTNLKIEANVTENSLLLFYYSKLEKEYEYDDITSPAGAAIEDKIAAITLLLNTASSVTIEDVATESTLADIKISAQLLDNAISGSEMQVDVVAALPTGGNMIGLVNMGATGTTSSVAASTSSVQLLAANSNRVAVHIHNDGNRILYIKCGTGASAASFTYRLTNQDHETITDYTGVIHGSWNIAVGTARITEITK